MQLRKRITRYKVPHLLFWILVCGIWFFLRVDDYPSPAKAFVVTIVKVVELALMIYITNYILIPQLLYRKKILWFTGLFILMVLSGSVIKMNFLGHYLDNPLLYDWSSHLKDRIYDNILPHFFLVIAGAAAKLLFDYGKLQQRMAETAKEKAEAELNFLKSQINPHFLFNSLNAVFFLIDKKNQEARNALHTFSEMLRFQLYEVKGSKISIEKEVAYLKDYLTLQQLRRDENCSVSFHCSADVKDFVIEPLLLIPFVENSFKYVSHHADKPNFINLKLRRGNGSFFFSITNSKEENGVVQRGGIGIANVKRRLELLYPGKHELTIDETEVDFSVTLNLSVA